MITGMITDDSPEVRSHPHICKLKAHDTAESTAVASNDQTSLPEAASQARVDTADVRKSNSVDLGPSLDGVKAG